MMTDEEFEKKKEFILKQRVKFAVGMKQLRKAHLKSEHVVARAERVGAQSRETVARIQDGTHDGFKNVRAKINDLIDSQMRTEDDLRNLHTALDRHFRLRRNRN